MATASPATLKVVSTNRAVFDLAPLGAPLLVACNGGTCDVIVPLAIPPNALAAFKIQDYLDVEVTPLYDPSGNSKAWSLGIVGQDPISGYVTFRLVNHTVNAQPGSEGAFLFAVNLHPVMDA